MHRLLLVALLALPFAVAAQTVQQQSVDPNAEALGREVMECVSAKVTERAQLIVVQRQVADLQKQLADLKDKAAPAPK